MNRIILPINPKPELISYIHYSNPLAILTNDTLRGKKDGLFGDMCWDFQEFYDDPGEPGYFINPYQCTPSVSTEGDNSMSIHLKSDKPCDTKSGFLYNLVKGDGSFTVRIDSVSKISPWTNAGIMLYRDPPYKNIVGLERITDMRIARIGRGDIMVTVFHEGEDIVPWTFSPSPVAPDAPVWLKLIRTGNHFSLLCSPDGEHFEEHFNLDLDIPDNIAIGYYCASSDDGFISWFYQNHIQLHCSEELKEMGGGVPLDFFGAPRIRDIYTATHPWLVTDTVSTELISLFPSFTAFAINCICQGYYVEAMLNEAHLPFSHAYHVKDFPHRSMIYGFDIEKEILYFVGYDQVKHYSLAQVSFEEADLAFLSLRAQQDIPIAQTCLYKPSAPDIDMVPDSALIKTLLTEYVQGINSGARYDYLVQDLPRIYGMKIYDEMLANISQVLDDQRISHLLWEHKKVMVKRIQFLKNFDLIPAERFDYLMEQSKNAEKLALMVRNFVIKYSVTHSPTIADSITQKLELLKNCEAEYLPVLIDNIL